MKLSQKVFRILAIIMASFTAFILLVEESGIGQIPFHILTLIAAAITVLVIYLYISSTLKPSEKIFMQMDNIAKGELEITPKDSAKTIHNLNIITERLRKYETKLSKQKEGFNTIIETIKEAIWIQDNKGIITVSNFSFNKFVEQDKVKDQYFWNIIRNKELYNLADRIFKQPSSITEEINLDGKHFLCSTSFSPLTEETVFILYDITEFRNLERVKKDFVLNVSHELRTPLTSIKGYLETFEDELDEEHKGYAQVIKRNTDRLIHIVNDLLTLSRLEHDRSLEKENILISGFLENITKIFSHRIKEKGLVLKVEQDKVSSVIQADRYKLEQVFINVIDNAIKYTDRGEVSIKVEEKDNQLIFCIADNGNGIAEKHLSRLFERFYVVDKSRSRKLGGTGLGLSIVKHIINLHNGTINVKSRIGVGTEFIVTIPQND